MTTFTTQETKLLTACMQFMNTDFSSAINFDKVAIEAGYKDAKNAKVMFMRLKKAKLDAGAGARSLISKKPAKVTPSGPRKSGGGVTKAGSAKVGQSKKGKASIINGTGSADTDDAEMIIKAETGDDGDDEEETSGLELDSLDDLVKREGHGSDSGVTDGQKVNGFTAINHKAVSAGDVEKDEEA